MLRLARLACGVAPAERRRQRDLNIGADRVTHLGAEFERFEFAAQHCEVVDRLGAVITAIGDLGGEDIDVAAAGAAEADGFWAQGDLDALSDGQFLRQRGAQALARLCLDETFAAGAFDDFAVRRRRFGGLDDE